MLSIRFRRDLPLGRFFAAVLLAVLFVGSPLVAVEPLRGWAPLSTRPLHPKYAAHPSKAVYPQPLITISPQPTPYPYGYFGATNRHPSIGAGPGKAPGTGAITFGGRR